MILVGCPVANRDWIINAYLEHVTLSLDKTGLDYGFIFLGDVANDPTFPLIDQYLTSHHGVDCTLAQSVHDTPMERPHAWKPSDYPRMAELRNQLLREVRKIAPTYFLSLDSDILLHENTVSQLLETAQKYDAVGGKCYMTRPTKEPTEGSRRCPSYGKLLVNGNFRRTDSVGVIQVDILMAIKLISQRAYNIDYMYDHRGEDLGWSRNCRNAGLRLGWDGRTANKHVFSPEYLLEVDERVGF